MMGAPVPNLAAVPSWDALFADPSVFKALPSEMQDALYEQVAVMEARLRANVVMRQRNEQAARPEPDRAVRIDEAVDLLGMSKDFLYRHWRKLGGYRDDDGHVKFAMSVIQRHLRTRRS